MKIDISIIGKGLIFVILLCSIRSYSQTVIVDYVFNSRYLPDGDSLDSFKNKESLLAKLDLQLLNSIKYQLIHSGNRSIFFSPETNSIFLDEEVEDVIEFRNLSISKMASVTYKDFSKNETLQREHILDKPFIIKDSLHSYKWILLSDEKIINGINCKLAKTEDVYGVEVYAWYAEAFPLINGPSIYHGLPGLIIQINSKKYDFELVSIKFIKSNANIVFAEKGEFIDQNNFVKLLKKKLANFNIEY